LFSPSFEQGLLCLALRARQSSIKGRTPLWFFEASYWGNNFGKMIKEGLGVAAILALVHPALSRE